MQTTPSLWQKSEELKILLMKVKEESGKVGLNSIFRKLRSRHPVPHFMANIWRNSGNSDRLDFLGLQMVIAAMQSKEAYSLEGKL